MPPFASSAARLLSASALGLLLSIVVAYSVGEIHVHWYMSTRGVVDRSELGGDYGFAFDNLVATVFAWLAALCICSALAWRWLARFCEKRPGG